MSCVSREPTQEEQESIIQLRRALEDEGYSLNPKYMQANFNEGERSLLYRFLVSRDFDLMRAKGLLIGDIKWREEVDMLSFQSMPLEQVLGCDSKIYEEHYWSQLLGYDDDGEPVIFRSLTGMRTSELIGKHTTVERVVQAQLWEFEQHTRLLYPEDKDKEVFPPRKLNYIITIRGMHWGQLTKDLLAILGGFSDVSKLHHPERLRTLAIVHAPALFSLAWNIISRFVPQATRDKIRILSHGQTESDPFMQQWLPKVRPPGIAEQQTL